MGCGCSGLGCTEPLECIPRSRAAAAAEIKADPAMLPFFFSAADGDKYWSYEHALVDRESLVLVDLGDAKHAATAGQRRGDGRRSLSDHAIALAAIACPKLKYLAICGCDFSGGRIEELPDLPMIEGVAAATGNDAIWRYAGATKPAKRLPPRPPRQRRSVSSDGCGSGETPDGDSPTTSIGRLGELNSCVDHVTSGSSVSGGDLGCYPNDGARASLPFYSDGSVSGDGSSQQYSGSGGLPQPDAPLFEHFTSDSPPPQSKSQNGGFLTPGETDARRSMTNHPSRQGGGVKMHSFMRPNASVSHAQAHIGPSFGGRSVSSVAGLLGGGSLATKDPDKFDGFQHGARGTLFDTSKKKRKPKLSAAYCGALEYGGNGEYGGGGLAGNALLTAAIGDNNARRVSRMRPLRHDAAPGGHLQGDVSHSGGYSPSHGRPPSAVRPPSRSARSVGRSTTDSPPAAESTGRDTTSQRSGESAGAQMLASFDSPSSAGLSPRAAPRSRTKSASPPHAGDFPEATTLLPPAQKHLHPISPIERDGRQATLALSITGVDGDDAFAFSVMSPNAPTPGVGDGSSRSRSLCSSSRRTPSVGSPLPEPDVKGGRCRRRTVRQSGLDFATAMTISVPDRPRGFGSGQSSPRRVSPASPVDGHQVNSNGTAPEVTTPTRAQARPTNDSPADAHEDGLTSAATTATTADTPFVDAGIETAAPAPRLSFAKPETGAPSNGPRGSGECNYLLGRQTAPPQWARDSFWNSEGDVAADTKPPAAVACARATAGRLTPTGGGMPDWLLKSTTTVGTSENEGSCRIPSVKIHTDDEQARTSNEDHEVPKRNEKTNSLEIPHAETCIGRPLDASLEHAPSASELLRRGTSALFGRSETSVHSDGDVHTAPMPTQHGAHDDDDESGPIVDVSLHTECPPPRVLSSTQAAKVAKKRRASVSFPQLAVTSDATDDGGPSGADSPASGDDGEVSGSVRRHSFVEKMRESMAAVGVSKDVLDQSFDPGSLSNSFRRKSPVAGMKAMGGGGGGGSSSNADASAGVDRANGATLRQERPPPISDVIASPDAERRTSDTFDQSETTIRVKFLKKGGGRKMPDSMPFALAIATLKDTQRHSITVNVNAPVLGHTESADHDPSCGEYSDVIRAVNASCRASMSHQSAPNSPPSERPVSARHGHHLLSRLSQPNGRLAHTVGAGDNSEENDGVMTVWATDAELPPEAIPRSVSVLSDAMQTLRTVQAEEAATELQQQQFSHNMQTCTSADLGAAESASGEVGSGHPLQSPPPPHDALPEELPGFVSDDKVSDGQLEQSGNRSSSQKPHSAPEMEQSMGRSTLAVAEQAVSGSLSQVASEVVLTQSDRRSSSASARTASVHSLHSMEVRETASALAEQNLVAGGTTDSQRASSVDTRSLQQDSVSTMPYPNGALTPLDGSRRSDDFHSGPSSPQTQLFRQGDLLAGGAQPPNQHATVRDQHGSQQSATVAGKQRPTDSRPTDSPLTVAASGRPAACVPVPVLLTTGSSDNGTAEEPPAIPTPTNGSKPGVHRNHIASTTAAQSNVATSARELESVGADAAKVAPPSPVDSPTKRKRTTVVTIPGEEDNYSPRSDRRSVVSKPSAVKQRAPARPFGMPSLSLLAKHAAIEELYVANCVNFAPAAMVHFLRNGGGRKLLAVSLEEIYTTEAALLAVARHCPELEVLHLQGIESAAVTVGVMRRLAAECPQLDEIVVDNGMYGRSLILELFEAGPDDGGAGVLQ